MDYLHRKIEMRAPEVLAVPLVESAEPLIDLKQHSEISFGPPPEFPEAEPYYTLIRRTVFEKLIEAQKSLPTGMRFRLYEGYRAPEIQAQLFAAQLERTRKLHPSAEERDIFNAAAKLASPLVSFDGQAVLPPHSTGGAIDIEIVKEGEVIDFGMEAKDWDKVAPEYCQTLYENLSTQAMQNRQLLVKVLSAVGFVNYYNEWWHYSYGDAYWAYLCGAPHAIYGQLVVPS